MLVVTRDLSRNCKISDFIHKSSRYVIDYCSKHNIDTIIIGHNKNWKQKINIGDNNNQKFVSIPHSTFINQVKYKAQEYGIKVIVNEESYTSKASFLDKDNIPDYKSGVKHEFSGNRIHRGLYKSKNGIFINADCNGAYNIMRKVILKSSLEDRIEGVGLHPVRINPSYRDSNKEFNKIYSKL